MNNMIVVNIKSSYPSVLAGVMDLDDATLGDWYQISDEAIRLYGDVILGVYKEKVVSAYDITGHTRDVEAQTVSFDGNDSETFAHLVGQRNPAAPWTRGQGRPIKYVSTDVVLSGEVDIEEVSEMPEGRRAVVKGYVLTVDADNIATVEPPAGGVVTVLAAGSALGR
ncbi:hypothetical protein VD659_14915 [Herbiconiux sp. 11R-BC]|uniref:hypothetical protein n=1 Tax=Herbiconiux sp. 11R-BC TaxID=3111637 RepID=UPI003C0E4F5E